MNGQQAPEWIERMRGASVLDVAAELGRDTKPARGSDGGQVYGCPACEAEQRHTKSHDRRGAVGIKPGGHGWHCFQCDASGDALHFVAYALRGQRFTELGDAAKAEVRDWCLRWTGLEAGSSTRHRATARRAQPAQAPEPAYPPADEVAALWSACGRVDADADVASWLLEERRIEPVKVADFALARVVSSHLQLPHWAGYGGEDGKPWRSWPSVGLQLVVPLYDHQGTLRSVLFRRPFESQESWPPKSVSARGARGGLVMACPLAKQVLEFGRRPEWLVGSELRVVITEGETDMLAWATSVSDADAPVATLAMFEGGWTERVASRIPDHSVVVIATDDDKPGDKYAAQIIKTLAGRIRSGRLKAERWKP